MNKLASIIILTYNSAKYIENCLGSVFNQTHKNFEILVIDNNSKDETMSRIERIGNNAKIELILNKENTGYAAGNNLGIRKSRGEYIFLVNPDVVLDTGFVKEIIDEFEKDSTVGSMQGKIYQLIGNQKTKIIDTLGFEVFKSGRIIDKGQGNKDNGKYDEKKEIFGVNGAVPAYRRRALNEVKLREEYLDEDFFCYVEDIDLAWRLKSMGWKSFFLPTAIAWHDRTSSKSISGGWKKFRETRKSQSLWMRKISWRNTWLLFVKNLPFSWFFRPQFLKRQIKFFFYLLFFEPRVLFSVFEIIKLLPKMIKKREVILSRKKIC